MDPTPSMAEDLHNGNTLLKINYEWRVQNYKGYKTEGYGEALESPRFPGPNGHSFKIIFYPGGATLSDYIDNRASFAIETTQTAQLVLAFRIMDSFKRSIIEKRCPALLPNHHADADIVISDVGSYLFEEEQGWRLKTAGNSSVCGERRRMLQRLMRRRKEEAPKAAEDGKKETEAPPPQEIVLKVIIHLEEPPPCRAHFSDSEVGATTVAEATREEERPSGGRPRKQRRQPPELTKHPPLRRLSLISELQWSSEDGHGKRQVIRLRART
ncbi:hypothetical protein SASPL_147556 [Salvia splendens]|uniref:MATH domain-containing protein n=1 Tax=Salvia splendens TaxID=180675 RepID=A0A8X8Z6Q7_SALSN|nr:hypothetical protein SASPL_147556 [Salvia splendens]